MGRSLIISESLQHRCRQSRRLTIRPSICCFGSVILSRACLRPTADRSGVSMPDAIWRCIRICTAPVLRCSLRRPAYPGIGKDGPAVDRSNSDSCSSTYVLIQLWRLLCIPPDLYLPRIKAIYGDWRGCAINLFNTLEAGLE